MPMNQTLKTIIEKNEKIIKEYHPSSNKYKRAQMILSLVKHD